MQPARCRPAGLRQSSQTFSPAPVVERHVRAGAHSLLVAALVLGGCLGSPADDPAPLPAGTPGPELPRYLATCDAALLFQVVPYSETDQFLPPGFHPRDPQEFLSFLPVALGQAGVIVLMLFCESEAGEAHESSSVAIFVESPAVDGVEDALFDFYEVERYGAHGEFGGVLARAGWPRLAGDVNASLDPELLPQQVKDQDVMAWVEDGSGLAMRFGGSTNAPVNVGSGVVRFWRDGPSGLAYYEYDTSLPAQVGTGWCEARPDTALAVFAPTAVPFEGFYFRCPPAEPVVAHFPRIDINATAGYLPGVHAG